MEWEPENGTREIKGQGETMCGSSLMRESRRTRSHTLAFFCSLNGRDQSPSMVKAMGLCILGGRSKLVSYVVER